MNVGIMNMESILNIIVVEVMQRRQIEQIGRKWKRCMRKV